MGLSDELAYGPAADVAAQIRRGKLSPVEAVDAFIERIEERKPSINAIIHGGFDEARRAAELPSGRRERG